MNKSNLIAIIIFVIVFVVLAVHFGRSFYRFHGFFEFREQVKKTGENVIPFTSNFLELLINKKHDTIYDEYIKKNNISYEEYSNQLEETLNNIGKPISYQYIESQVGGVGYFQIYTLTSSNGNKYNCVFFFRIDTQKNTVTENSLQTFSIERSQNTKNTWITIKPQSN